MSIGPVRLNHTVLFVADLTAEARRWSGAGTAGRLLPGSAEVPA